MIFDVIWFWKEWSESCETSTTKEHIHSNILDSDIQKWQRKFQGICYCVEQLNNGKCRMPNNTRWIWICHTLGSIIRARNSHKLRWWTWRIHKCKRYIVMRRSVSSSVLPFFNWKGYNGMAFGLCSLAFDSMPLYRAARNHSHFSDFFFCSNYSNNSLKTLFSVFKEQTLAFWTVFSQKVDIFGVYFWPDTEKGTRQIEKRSHENRNNFLEFRRFLCEIIIRASFRMIQSNLMCIFG